MGLFLLAMGLWSAGTLTVALLLSTSRTETTGLRWFAAAAALPLAGLLWWSPPLRQSDALLLVPVLLGFALGLPRPFSYLWQMPLSLTLALVARLGLLPATRLLKVHPVNLDELVLLPLPGLTGLLVRACQQDVPNGTAWLLHVAAHPSQGWLARQALARLAAGPVAHQVLFWLSTEPEGVRWLQRLAANVARPHPLIAAYAAFGAVEAPAAWPYVIAAHRPALCAARDQPGGVALLALVDTGAQTLAAERWSAALVALQDRVSSPQALPEPLEYALTTMQTWSDQRIPTLIDDRATALAVLWDDVAELDGWPAQLLDAMAEQLVYLLLVEYRRGAWLV